MTHSIQSPKNINRVAHSVGRALTLGTNIETWIGVALIFRARLTPQERAALAVSALRSLEPSDAAQVFEFACPFADYPLPTLDNVMSSARWWASLADATELKGFAVASFEAMAPNDQIEFLRWASEQRRAAA